MTATTGIVLMMVIAMLPLSLLAFTWLVDAYRYNTRPGMRFGLLNGNKWAVYLHYDPRATIRVWAGGDADTVVDFGLDDKRATLRPLQKMQMYPSRRGVTETRISWAGFRVSTYSKPGATEAGPEVVAEVAEAAVVDLDKEGM